MRHRHRATATAPPPPRLQGIAYGDLVEHTIVNKLATTLFDEDGTLIGGACFLEEAGAAPRVTSRSMPRSWASALPDVLLTLGPLTTRAAMADMAQATSCDDLHERVMRWAPTMCESCWEGMACQSPPFESHSDYAFL